MRASTLGDSVVPPNVLSSARAAGIASSSAVEMVAKSSPEVPSSPILTSQDASTRSLSLSTSPDSTSTAANFQPALLPALPDSISVPASDKPIPMRFTRLPVTLAEPLTVPGGPLGPSSSASSHQPLPSPQASAQVAKTKKVRTLTVVGALAAVTVLAGTALAVTLGRRLICLRAFGVMTGRRCRGVGGVDGMSDRGEDGDGESVFRPDALKFLVPPRRGATSGSIYSHLSSLAVSSASTCDHPLRISLPSPADDLRTLALPVIAHGRRTSDGSINAASGSLSSDGPSGFCAVPSAREASSLSEPGSRSSRPPSCIPELGLVSRNNESAEAELERLSIASRDYGEGEAQAIDPFSDAGGFEWVSLPRA
ncbi:hypothetical protein JCM21900_005419 [Sporobolomyces salmonicolor]